MPGPRPVRAARAGQQAVTARCSAGTARPRIRPPKRGKRPTALRSSPSIQTLDWEPATRIESLAQRGDVLLLDHHPGHPMPLAELLGSRALNGELLAAREFN